MKQRRRFGMPEACGENIFVIAGVQATALSSRSLLFAQPSALATIRDLRNTTSATNIPGIEKIGTTKRIRLEIGLEGLGASVAVIATTGKQEELSVKGGRKRGIEREGGREAQGKR